MKIYLAKSNNANPVDVQWVRNHLTRMGHEVVEYVGGKYDPQQILATDFVLAISHPTNQPESGFKFIGRGIHGQLESSMKKGIPAAIIHSADELDVKISPIIKVEKHKTEDCTFEYGKAQYDTHQLPIREVLGSGEEKTADVDTSDDSFLASL